MNPSTIKLFLLYNDVTRLRTAEISNWSGKAIAGPRTDLGFLLQRPELEGPGVYLLLGTAAEDDRPIAYIGEAEATAVRLKQQKSKEFWTSVIVVVSKDGNLTKAHTRYLEGRLIEIASGIGWYKLQNAQPSGSSLPESEKCDMEAFLDRMRQLLPVLGTNILTPIITDNVDSKTLFTKVKAASARGQRSRSGFVVFEGSTAVAEVRPATIRQGSWIVALREKLKTDGDLVLSGSVLRFCRDVEFNSPSAAAAVIHGGNVAGPAVWKNSAGKSLKEIEDGD